MPDDTNKRRPRLADPTVQDYSGFGAAYGMEEAPKGNVEVWRPRVPGSAADQAEAAIITAQKVAVKRDVAGILATVTALAAKAGMAYVYRIPFKDKKTGRVNYVEGPTIKLANDLARTYGNCRVQIDVRDDGNAWTFKARFTDYETGFTTERLFQQRKSQDSGMKDAARQLDIVFQIGQSKAIRNVIVNTLGTFADVMVEVAKSGIQERINKNPDGARKWILEQFRTLEIEVKRVVRIYGKAPDKWTVPDMAKLYAEISAIHDGMADPEDLYPIDEDKADELAEAQQEGGDEKSKTAAKKTTPKEQNRDDEAKTAGSSKPDGDSGSGGRPSGSTSADAAEEEGGKEEAPEDDAKVGGVDGEASSDEGEDAPASSDEGEEDQGDLLVGD